MASKKIKVTKCFRFSVPIVKPWIREPTRAQLAEGPACQDWPTGKLLTKSWKEPHGTFFSGIRRQPDHQESRTIWTNLTPPYAKVTKNQPILDNFLTETLPARRSAWRTRWGRRTWGMTSTPWPPWTKSPPRWADRTRSPSSPLRTWDPTHDPPVRASSSR